MATNQVIVIQIKDKDGNENRYYNQSDILHDILFEVGGDSNGFKTTFHVHQSVLLESASIFKEICETEQSGDIKTIPICGVEPYIFHHLVFDMYGGMVSSNILRDHAKDIIETADRFGVEKLKLKAEEMYLEQNAITFDNIMDTLLYSDTKNCTIIKAAIMDCLVRLSDTAFVQQLSFKGVPGHLMKDLLAAVVRIVGDLAEKVKVTAENVKTNRAEIALLQARQLETEERLSRSEERSAQYEKRFAETLAQIKMGVRKKYKQQKAEARAKLRKAIVLSFFVGLLSAVTIEYVFACIMDYM